MNVLICSSGNGVSFEYLLKNSSCISMNIIGLIYNDPHAGCKNIALYNNIPCYYYKETELINVVKNNKIDLILFDSDSKDLMEPWIFTSNIKSLYVYSMLNNHDYTAYIYNIHTKKEYFKMNINILDHETEFNKRMSIIKNIVTLQGLFYAFHENNEN